MTSRARVGHRARLLGIAALLALGAAPQASAQIFGQVDATGGAPPMGLAASLAARPDPSLPVAAGTGLGELLKSGRASWYGPRFHGRRTASGERYDQEAMTAAMTGIALGTRVRVVRVDGGASVVVRVNDRGPYERKNGRWVPHGTRVIDLSRAAMRRLGGLDAGVIRVRVYRAP